jgi:hypoxanthine phosphoribosyltransferase
MPAGMSQVEDIVDTGRTALRLKELLLSQGAQSVRLVTLLDKAERRTCDIQPDYCCFAVTFLADETYVGESLCC